MTDREALLANILANPEDDLPRLVYADWLEENGYGRWAEFIRGDVRFDHKAPDAQLQLLNLENLWGSWPDEDDPRTMIREHCPTLKEWAILPEHMVSRREPAYMLMAIVRRGFVAEVRGPLHRLLTHLPTLVKREPVVRVVATDRLPSGSVSGDYWWIFAHEGQSYYMRAADGLPTEIILPMSEIENPGQWSGTDPSNYTNAVRFPTETDALDALSAALLAWARG